MHKLLLLILAFGAWACSEKQTVSAQKPAGRPAFSLGIVGDTADVSTTTQGGILLMGGGTDVDNAIRWMIGKSGGGDFVVIRASGTDAYNSYIQELGRVNSVETLLINSRQLADDPAVAARVRNAEALFITGGDQANYVNFWKGTRLAEAINYLRDTKQVPVGGTSAGCAVMGEFYFAALNGTVTSEEALANPYDAKMSLQRGGFVQSPLLAATVTDTHFGNRDRQGRLLAFLARMAKDHGVLARGIGVDERTAVCIEPDGLARVFGSGTAYFAQQNAATEGPERCEANQPLDWNRNRRAVRVHPLVGSPDGSVTFDLKTWDNPEKPRYFHAVRGVFGVAD